MSVVGGLACACMSLILQQDRRGCSGAASCRPRVPRTHGENQGEHVLCGLLGAY
jgi:hypothetical protein